MNTTLRNTTTLLRFPSGGAQICGERVRKISFWILFFVAGFIIFTLIDIIHESPVEASSQQVSLLEIPLPKGTIPNTLKFPVYEQQSIQYFSAGLGKEERSLTFPPYPLKLIFVQGERAYLTGVSIHLANEDGTLEVMIPGKEVEGPWLFINAPTGTYTLHGTDSNGTTLKKTITIQNDTQTSVHFLFP